MHSLTKVHESCLALSRPHPSFAIPSQFLRRPLNGNKIMLRALHLKLHPKIAYQRRLGIQYRVHNSATGTIGR